MAKAKVCPGSKIRSKGKGRGLGKGKGKGPIGRPLKRKKQEESIMGYDVAGWLSDKIFGSGKRGKDPQEGVSGYMKPKAGVTKALDEAGDISPVAPRRGDTDEDYDTYSEDRNVDEEEENE